MANVQPDKFTKIANELLEVVPLFNFNGTQLRIILVVWRYTYGFKRKNHEISISFLVKATGISKRQLQKEVNNLINYKVLHEVRKATFNTTRIIEFNKDYDQWLIEHSITNEQQENKRTQVNNSTPQQVNSNAPQQVNNSSSKKEIFKENIKETTTVENPFQFYSENFQMITPFIAESIEQWEMDLSTELVVEAMKIANKQGVRKFNYVEGILRDWKNKNYKSLSDVQSETVKQPRGKKEYKKEDFDLND